MGGDDLTGQVVTDNDDYGPINPERGIHIPFLQENTANTTIVLQKICVPFSLSHDPIFVRPFPGEASRGAGQNRPKRR